MDIMHMHDSVQWQLRSSSKSMYFSSYGAWLLTCVYICYVDVHRRLWLTPSLSGQPETLNCYDFEPTGTNDLRSLVAKVNRKLSRNQFKGLRVLFFFVTHWLNLPLLLHVGVRKVSLLWTGRWIKYELYVFDVLPVAVPTVSCCTENYQENRPKHE